MITSIKQGLIVGLIIQSVSLGAGIDNWNTTKIVWRIVWIVVCYAIYLVLERKIDNEKH